MNNALLKQAGDLHRQGEFAKAISIYRQLLAEHPNHTELLHVIAILSAELGEYDNAVATIETAIMTEPTNATLHNSKGNILLRIKAYPEATRAFQKATKLKPNYAKAFDNLGNCLSAQDKLSAAKLAYETALKLEPYNANAHNNYGILLTKLNQTTAAIEQLKLALKYQPQHPQALGQLGHIYLQQEAYQQAIDYFERRLALEPNHAETWHSLGLAYLKLKDAVKAIAAFETTLKIKPKHSDAHHQLGTAYLQLNQHKKALQHYLRQIEANPHADSFYNAGVLLMYKEHNREATDYLTQALELDPNNVGAHLNLGAIYLKSGIIDSAINHYQAAKKLKPHDVEISYILSAIRQQDQPERAPNEFLQHLFDQYAGYYDKHLTECLKYQVPEKIHQAVITAIDTNEPAWTVLDLGCGTGLCGEQFKPQAKRLIGIDVSASMIDIAQTKHIYDELKVGDLIHILPNYHDIDLITAADVFTYIGKLEHVFELAHAALKPTGMLVFSVESTDQYPCALQQTARYSHSKRYLQELIDNYQFTELSFDNLKLREQHKQPVNGYLVLLRK